MYIYNNDERSMASNIYSILTTNCYLISKTQLKLILVILITCILYGWNHLFKLFPLVLHT